VIVRGEALMLRDVSWSRGVRSCVAGCLLLLLAGGGGGAKARPGDGTEDFAEAASAQTPAQNSPAQQAGKVVCPVTAETNPPLSAALAGALVLYRTGKFEEAIAAYNAVAPIGGSEAAAAYAGLARVYLKQHKVAEAYEAATKAVALTPDRAPAVVALGEVYYRQGKLGEAEEVFLKPLRNCNLDARAFLGLTHIHRVSLNFKLAKNEIDQAYKLDPADPDIRRTYLGTLSGAERVKFLRDYLAAATDDDAETRQAMERELTMLEGESDAREQQCRLVNDVSKTETRLQAMLYDPRHIRGYGLAVKLNGVPSRLMLDTGASGILVDSKIAEKAGIKSIVDNKIHGIGDKAAMAGFAGYAEKIQIGELEFQGCILEVAAGRSVMDGDGLIGADVFRHFLVDMDMPNSKFKLSPLPAIPDEAAATSLDTSSAGVRHFRDRYIPPEMKDYTRIFLFGHHMLIPTRVNGAAGKLFLIDTGSFDDTLSPATAKEVTKLNLDEKTQVKGLNGSVKQVYRASHAKLQFSHFYQDRQDLVTFDLTNISNADGTEVSGVLGFAMLVLLDMKIDYRDGLVDFRYGGERFH
jgi:tetratricopeptide (TPR) repeat protein/predicted aspartyl protease